MASQCCASTQKSKKEILKILNKQPIVDFNSTDKRGDTIIHTVCKNFTVKEIVKILKTTFARGNEKNFNDTTSNCPQEQRLRDSLCALKKRKASTRIKKCRNNGDLITHAFVDLEYENYCNSSSDSTRHKLVSESIQFFEWLVSKGFNFDLKNKKGMSAVQRAFEYNLQHIVLVLFNHTNNVHRVTCNDETLLHSFLEIHFECRDGKQCDSQGKSFASKIIKTLLDRGVSADVVNKDGLTALDMAVNSKEDIEIVDMLLDWFTKVEDKCGVELVFKASRNVSSKSYNYFGILRALISKGVDVNGEDEQKVRPIYYAVMQEHLLAVQLMKDNGANFNIITSSGRNLLHVLADKRWNDEPTDDSQMTELFEILLNEGCDVNAVDNTGQKPLNLASKSGKIVIVKKLLEHNAEVNYRENSEKKSPLHLAVENGHLEVAKLLLEKDAHVNCRDRRNSSPLHAAAALPDEEFMVQILLKQGALVNARDNERNSALLLAARADNIDCIDDLVMYGANINDKRIIESLPSIKRTEACEMLLQHWVKLQTANLPCSEEYKNLLEHEEYQSLHEHCLQEIEFLKFIFIVKTDISLYDWLHMDCKHKLAHSRNEILKNIVDSPTLHDQFPQYSSVILGNYYETLTRKALLEPAKEVWMKKTEIYLPDLCLENILSYLNSEDLMDIIGMDTYEEIDLGPNWNRLSSEKNDDVENTCDALD